jgi:hypothetical protein
MSGFRDTLIIALLHGGEERIHIDVEMTRGMADEE